MPALHIMLKPASSACNLRCSYCFYQEEAACRKHADHGIMTEDTARHLIAQVYDYAAASANARVSFSFQGGEPLLAGYSFFHSFVNIAKEYNKFHIPVEFALQTNGTLLDHAYAAFFAKERFLIGLSLDGIPTVHNQFRTDPQGMGTYNGVRRAAQLLRKHAVPYNILCVVTDALCVHGAAVWSSLREHRYLQFIPCLPPITKQDISYAPTPEHYAAFLDAVFCGYYRDFRRGNIVSVRTFDNWLNLLLRRPPESCAMCGVCMPSLIAEANGDLYPCDFYALDEYRLGNINDSNTTIANLLHSHQMQTFLSASHTIPDVCRRCRYYPLCRNGCRRERTLPDGRTHHCTAYRLFFERHIGHLEEMANIIEQSIPNRRSP